MAKAQVAPGVEVEPETVRLILLPSPLGENRGRRSDFSSQTSSFGSGLEACARNPRSARGEPRDRARSSQEGPGSSGAPTQSQAQRLLCQLLSLQIVTHSWD